MTELRRQLTAERDLLPGTETHTNWELARGGVQQSFRGVQRCSACAHAPDIIREVAWDVCSNANDRYGVPKAQQCPQELSRTGARMLESAKVKIHDLADFAQSFGTRRSDALLLHSALADFPRQAHDQWARHWSLYQVRDHKFHL